MIEIVEEQTRLGPACSSGWFCLADLNNELVFECSYWCEGALSFQNTDGGYCSEFAEIVSVASIDVAPSGMQVLYKISFWQNYFQNCLKKV